MDDFIYDVDVQHAIEELTRVFRSNCSRLEIRKKVPTFSDLGEESDPGYVLVYAGDGLINAQGGDVNRYGAGIVENYSKILLIAGQADIRQGDFISIVDSKYSAFPRQKERLYRVQDEPNVWGAWTRIILKQHEQ